jgi:hypothetical protein
MFGSTILDTVIAMSFVFLLVSLFVTTINEMVASALRSRAKWLRLGIEQLLGSVYANKLFQHPLIESFSSGPAAQGSDKALKATGPSYIPSRAFTTVLLDLVAKGVDERGMRDAIEKLPDQKLRTTLTVLLDDAKNDIETFKQNIEIWFNNGMDRVGGWYKRRSQWVIGAIALIVTIIVNVDALLILQQLNTQAGLRDALVAQAKTLAERPPVWITQGVTTAPSDAADKPANGPAPTEKKLQRIEAQLNALSLPIGWFHESSSTGIAGNIGSNTDDISGLRRANFLVIPWERDDGRWGLTIGFHIVGWILTALAASLGAPFWFDVLNKIMSIRSAGKAPEEKPKAPKEVPVPLEPGQTPQQADAANANRK